MYALARYIHSSYVGRKVLSAGSPAPAVLENYVGRKVPFVGLPCIRPCCFRNRSPSDGRRISPKEIESSNWALIPEFSYPHYGTKSIKCHRATWIGSRELSQGEGLAAADRMAALRARLHDRQAKLDSASA